MANRPRRSTGRPRVLRRDGGNLAMIVPLPLKRSRRRIKRELTEQDIADFRAAAGGWADLDVDRFLADVYTSRDLASTRPPVDL